MKYTLKQRNQIYIKALRNLESSILAGHFVFSLCKNIYNVTGHQPYKKCFPEFHLFNDDKMTLNFFWWPYPEWQERYIALCLCIEMTRTK